MATPRKDPKDRLPMGRPSEYRREYCEMLIDHMRQGGSFESFAGTAGCSKQTLYTWSEAHPDFLDAKKIGLGLNLQFWEGVGRMQATGQLKRVKTEEPKVDKEGNVMYDRKGEIIMKRTYEAANGSAATLIFFLKNMHGWRDKRDVNIGGQEGAPPVTMNLTGLTNEQLQKRYDELIAKAVKK